MDSRRPNRNRIPTIRGLVVLTGAAAIWAAVVQLFGGFFLRLGPVVVSSRRTGPPMVVALVSVAAAVALGAVGNRDETIAELRLWQAAVGRAARASLSFIGRHAMLIPLAILLFVVVQSVGRWTTVRPLWLDEESTLINVRDRGFTELPGAMWFGQSAPLAWMAAERTMMLAVGDGDRSLRLFPLVLGLGMCGVAYLIGRRWLNAIGATVFVFCCAFGQWFVHNRFEAKPYSADAFTALLLAALVAWALDAETTRDRRRRAIVWWVTAAATLWVANGAMLVAPGCVLILIGVIWKRDGFRAAVATGAWGGLWLASFGLCYWLSLRFTLGSTYLYNYWASVSAFPDEGVGFATRFQWLSSRFESLASNPGGTTLWLALWLSMLAGLLVSRRRVLALLAAAAVLTALILGFVHVVPLHERIALWMMPSGYLAVALLADRAGEWLRSGVRRRAWWLVAVAIAVAVPIACLCSDLFSLRDHDASEMGGTPTNHALDDRLAVAWLLDHRAPGDTMLTTHLGWPAIWWYGRISMADGTPAAGGHFADGGAQLETGFDPSGDSCHNGTSLADALRDRRRVLVYVGFPDQSGSFGAALEAQLKTIGTVVDEQRFGEGSTMILDVHVPARLPSMAEGQPCIGASPAVRW